MEQTISDMVTNYLIQSDEKNFEELLERFQPLTRKYAKKLYYLEFEDSLQELNLAIYEAVSQLTYIKNEYACISYIKKAVFHKFCKLYASSEAEHQKRENQVCYDDLTCQSDDLPVKNAIFFLDLERELESMCLVKKQIVQLLLKGYSDKEIGAALNCSRQYVNRVKKSILKTENT